MIFIRTNKQNLCLVISLAQIAGETKSTNEYDEFYIKGAELPVFDDVSGKSKQIYYTPTRGFWCEYIAKPQEPETQEQRIKRLEDIILQTNGVV